MVVGVLFLSFTVTFFIGNTLIHSYFSSATKPPAPSSPACC